MISNKKAPTRTLAILRHGGTHLVKPLLKCLIGKSYASKKLNIEPIGPVIVCTRDPRNIAISGLRYKRKNKGFIIKSGDKGTDDMLAHYLSSPKEDIGTSIEVMTAWANKWMSIHGAYILRFEDLCESEEKAVYIISRLAKSVGEDLSLYGITDVYRYFYGKRPFYTGSHSKWKDWFGPKSTAVWKKSGGDALVLKMGYGVDGR